MGAAQVFDIRINRQIESSQERLVSSDGMLQRAAGVAIEWNLNDAARFVADWNTRQVQDIPHESLDRGACSDGLPNRFQFPADFRCLDAVLSEARAGAFFLLPSVFPLGMQVELLFFHFRKQQSLVMLRAATEFHALEQRLDDIFTSTGYGNRNPEVALDRLMFSQQDIEHDAVDLIIDTEQSDDTDVRTGLAEPIDSAFALVVPRRIPRQVVMDD